VDINQEKAGQIIESLVTKASSRFKQELEGENDEILDRVLRQFRAKVARCSWKASQKWCKWNEDGPVLMPDFTRIYYRKGNTEILVQEFPPQVRLMKFKAALSNRENTSQELEGSPDSIQTYSLALPYVVFLFKFVNGTYTEVRCAFNDRPLRRLEERPLRPYISNLDSNLGVCLGSSFDRSQLQVGNITQQASYVLDHFWHSAYSDEWAAHFWNSRSHFQENDQRLSSLENWQEHSQENSLFVVEDVDWLKHQEESFGDIIVSMFEGDIENNDLQEGLYTELVEKFLEDIKKTYAESVAAVEERIAKPLSEQLTEDLMNQLQ
jgi:hypothetical protein